MYHRQIVRQVGYLPELVPVSNNVFRWPTKFAYAQY